MSKLRTDYTDESNEAMLNVVTWSDAATSRVTMTNFEGVPFTMELVVPKNSTRAAVEKSFQLMLAKQGVFMALLESAFKDHRLDPPVPKKRKASTLDRLRKGAKR